MTSEKYFSLGFWFYLIPNVLLMCVALRYMITDNILEYHESLLKPYGEINEAIRFIIVRFLNVQSSGWITTSAVVFIILFLPFRKREPWANWAILASLGGLGLLLTWQTGVVKYIGEVQSPFFLSLSGLILALIGFVSTLQAHRLARIGK